MSDKNWEGVKGAAEHRTVGPHRAWCHDDQEWCYPGEKCDCCMDTLGYEKRWVKREEA
jgi:hypothetical protein